MRIHGFSPTHLRVPQSRTSFDSLAHRIHHIAAAASTTAVLCVGCTSILGVDGEYITGDQNGVGPTTAGNTSAAAGGTADGSGGYGASGASGGTGDSGDFGGSTGAGTGTDSGGCANRALSFDGDENVVWVDDDPSLDPAGAISVEAWLEPSAAGLNDNEPQYIVGHISISELQGYLLYLDESGRVVFGHFGQGGWEDTEGQQKLAAGSWYHVAGSFDGATLRVFVNGALSGETAGDITSTSNCDCPLTIETARIHGSIEHLLLEPPKLYAASTLGQYLVWDLSALYAERCALLREVWERAPVVWRNGRAFVEPPPVDRLCQTTGQEP